MKVSISTDATANQMTITLHQLDWAQIQGAAFYQGEKEVQRLLAAIGQELTRQLLESKATTEPTLELKGRTYYRKPASTGRYQTLSGEVAVERHLYQTSAGGATICPLELACQLSFGSATPLLAECLSFKLSALTAGEVAQDLAHCHGLMFSASFIQHTAQRVGQTAVAKRECWKLEMPPPAAQVEIIASGLDGTTMPLVGEHYKEAMCGTISLYDTHGGRLSTEYLGAMPEAGKATFSRHFLSRVAQVKQAYPAALHVCLGDGAAWNWQLLKTHYPEAIWILDFYHAAQHLAQAADWIFGPAPSGEKTAWYAHWRTLLLEEPQGVAGLIRCLLYRRNRGELTVAAQRGLDTQLNYFREHAELMQYADYRAASLPISTGVTEAGCKELIKARFCRSGMRWKRETGAPILHLRAIRLSQQWDSFWFKVMRYVA
jgi:hypothetical protein